MRVPPQLARRAVLSLPVPLLFALSKPPAYAADTFDYVENGVTKKLTELEARDALTKKVDAATAAGKGLDVDRRGQFNEKALFNEDFYFKFGLRPDPEEVANSPFLPPQGELPFAPVQRRYTGYQKYQARVIGGITVYNNDLFDAIKSSSWAAIPGLLEKGKKGSGSNAQGEGTGVAPSEARSACRAFGLFANTVLQSENDSGTTTANLLARHLINEAYLSMDDIAQAANDGNQRAAIAAWTRGKSYINQYIRIVNLPISSKVGDKFPLITADFFAPPPPPPAPPPEPVADAAAGAA